MLTSSLEHRERELAIVSSAYARLKRARPAGSLAVANELTHYQFLMATDASVAAAEAIAEQGLQIAPVAVADVSALVGAASDGRSLVTLFDQASTAAAFQRIVLTQLHDVGRTSAGIGVTARPGAGYVRMIGPTACSRCAILAGRFYRWNAGFLRHPRCGCENVPTTDTASSELISDPYAYFNSLDPAAQDRAFTKAGAQAIRDGADMSQVVNARRGMTPNGNFTTEGTTQRGNASRGLNRGQRRMTPELIYKQAAGDRQMALDLMRRQGYILPQGQISAGALRGQVEGFGQLGGGGARRAASNAVEEARRTGVRDPRSRYTMTAAERRLFDARIDYERALSGINPYTSPGFGNTPDPYGQRLNRVGETTSPAAPAVVATAKANYLRWLKSDGQVF